MVALLGRLEARGAVLIDHGQSRGVRKVAQLSLATVYALRIKGSGFRVWGLRFRVKGLGFGV